MKIIVVGCGKIGKAVISSLVAEGHDVVAIDDDPAIVTEITNVYDVMGVCGNGADLDTLEEASTAGAEMFVALTGSDELNMLSCFIAGRMGVKHTIARIRNPEYNDRGLDFMRQHLGLSMSVNPEQLVAEEIYNLLKLPSAVRVENFSRRNFEMVELKLAPDSELDGLSLIKMREKYKAKYLICTVRRGDEIYIPDGRFVLRGGDRIGLTALHTEIEKLLKMLGVLKRQAKNIMILGGGKTSYYLAKMLSGVGGSNVKIIEKEKHICDELSSDLSKSVIIHGDGANQELLLEEGISSMDAFVSLTGMDEENIMISIFASMQNVPKVISKISRDELLSMARKLGVETVISPTGTTASILVRYARALENSHGSNIETLYKLMDGNAEALEFNVSERSVAANIPLKDLKLKKNILIAGIIRGGKTIIPSGDDMIMPDDKVIVICASYRLQDLDDILDNSRG